MIGSKEMYMAIMAYDIEVPASYDQLTTIERLMHNSTLEQRQIERLELEMRWMDEQQAENLINQLAANQQMTDKEIYKRLR